jgi:hypothetical protein
MDARNIFSHVASTFSQSQLELAVANYLDTFSEFDPSKMTMKIKLHLLTHTPQDSRRFGPLLGPITELFESFNAVFRYASISSNHLAPSRDIALSLAAQESLKHRITGGWWRHSPPGKPSIWVQAGHGVRSMIEYESLLQRLYALPSMQTLRSGPFTNPLLFE